MANLYIIVGDKDVGKSTLIRCLTGVYHKPYCDLCFNDKNNTKASFFVQLTSLQEEKKVEIKDLKDFLNTKENNIIFPLRYSKCSDEYPAGIEYIKKAKELGYKNIKVILLLEFTNLPKEYQKLDCIQIKPKESPCNNMAIEVRKHFGLQ